MKIIADENITDVESYFSSHGELITMPGRDISAEHLLDADALLVRSITKVNAQLLMSSKVKFVASATSGIDHIDTDYLKQKNIQFHYAPGCNANSVVEYVFCALAALRQQARFQTLEWTQSSFGIIGAGNIGNLLAQRLQALNIPFIIYDPYLDENYQYYDKLSSLDEVLQQNIISIHTPLTVSGEHPTYHLISREVISRLDSEQILINAARGGVVDNAALLDYAKVNKTPGLVLDAWENEPKISLELLDYICIGTPHIAGYSRDGKTNGTKSIYGDFCQFFGLQSSLAQGVSGLLGQNEINLELKDGSSGSDLNACLLAAYDINQDHYDLQKLLSLDGGEPGEEGISEKIKAKYFDQLRKSYPVRHEFTHYSLAASKLSVELASLGFSSNQA